MAHTLAVKREVQRYNESAGCGEPAEKNLCNRRGLSTTYRFVGPGVTVAHLTNAVDDSS
jgi:hypothetical protein